MTEFARGTLLSQTYVVASTQTVIFTAGIQTEILLVNVAPVPGIDPAISLMHDDTGTGTFGPETFLLLNYLVDVHSQGPMWAAQAIGAGIHVKRGGQLAVQYDASQEGAQFVISLYGVTTTLQPVR